MVEEDMSPFLVCYYDEVHWPIRGSERGEVEIFVEFFVCWDEFELVGTQGGVLVWLSWGVGVWRVFSTASLPMLRVLGLQGRGLRMTWRKQARGGLSCACQMVRIRGLLGMRRSSGN